jgi:hypothetical protein
MTTPTSQSRRARHHELEPFVERCRGVIDAEPCPRELGREVSPWRRRMVLIAYVLRSSMAFIDRTALPVALPKLRADFGADLASVQWVLNGYMLALASLTLIGGALADASVFKPLLEILSYTGFFVALQAYDGSVRSHAESQKIS